MFTEEFRRFREKQEAIYASFIEGANEARVSGFRQDPRVASSSHAYVIGLRFASLAKSVELLSRNMSERLPCLVYPASAAHVTIADRQMTDGDDVSDEINTFACRIAEWVANEGEGARLAFEISSGELLWNQHSVILACRPQREESIALRRVLKGEPSPEALKLGWGAHMTVARFVADTGVEEVKTLTRLIAESTIDRRSFFPDAIEIFEIRLSAREKESHIKSSVRFVLK